MVPLGGFYLQARDAAQPTVAQILQPFATGQNEVEVIGSVIREGIVRDGRYGGKQESVDVQTERLQQGDRVLNEAVGVRLTIYSKQADEDEARDDGNESPLHVYTYGQRLHFIAKLRMPRNYRNPGATDMAGYLASQGIRLTGSARATSVEVLPGFTGSRIGLWRSAARRSVLAHILQLWPGERGALMQAMLIGGRAFFGREIKTDFQRTGTYHILVVSGINVGILAFAAFWLLRRLPMGETWATITTILLSWGYAFLADLGSPIVRATITLNIYLLTRLLFRDRAALNGLGIAALGILLVNPRTLFEASFQLTFLSVIAVAGIAVPILRRIIYPLQNAVRNVDSPGSDFSLPTRAAQFRSDLRLIREQLGNIAGPRSANFVVVRGARFVLGAAELVFISTIIQIALALPDGVVLPSRDHDVAACQRAGDSDCWGAVACRCRGGRAVVCLDVAGLCSCVRQRKGAGCVDRYDQDHRPHAHVRCARADAGVGGLLRSRGCLRARSLAVTTSNAMGCGRPCRTVGIRDLDRAVPTKTAMAPRRLRDHGDRRRPG